MALGTAWSKPCHNTICQIADVFVLGLSNNVRRWIFGQSLINPPGCMHRSTGRQVGTTSSVFGRLPRIIGRPLTEQLNLKTRSPQSDVGAGVGLGILVA